MVHFLGCHQNAFGRLDGFPEKIMPDYVPREKNKLSPTTAVKGRCR
jgi:hypothetical protein